MKEKKIEAEKIKWKDVAKLHGDSKLFEKACLKYIEQEVKKVLTNPRIIGDRAADRPVITAMAKSFENLLIENKISFVSVKGMRTLESGAPRVIITLTNLGYMQLSQNQALVSLFSKSKKTSIKVLDQ